MKFVLVGCGFMGRMHATVLGKLTRAQLVAVVDVDAERRASFSEKFGVPAFSTLDEAVRETQPDAADICLPTYLHREYTEKAAHLGLHVLCEKPMARTASDAQAMINTCELAGVRLMIAHCIRFWPEYAHLKALKDSGELGKLTSINMTRYGQFPTWSAENWLADEGKAGGAALDMHIHDTDYALYLLGEPVHMSCYGTNDGRGIGQIYTTMQFRDGAVAHLQGGWNLPAGTPFKMAFRAIFEGGVAIFDGCPLTIYREGKDPEVVTFESESVEGGGNISDLGGYLPEIAYFVECVLENKPFEITNAASSCESLKWALREIENVHASLEGIH